MPQLSPLLICSLIVSIFDGAASVQCYFCTSLTQAQMYPVTGLASPYVDLGEKQLAGIQYNSAGCAKPTSGIKTIACRTACISFTINATNHGDVPPTNHYGLVRGCADQMLLGTKVKQTPGCCGKFDLIKTIKDPRSGGGVVCPCSGTNNCNTKPPGEMTLHSPLSQCIDTCHPNPCPNNIACFSPVGVDFRCGGIGNHGLNGTQAPFTLVPTGKTTPTVKTTTGSTMKPTTTVKGGGTKTTVKGTSGTGSTTTTKGKGSSVTASVSTTTITATTTAGAPTLNPLSLGHFLTLLAALLL